MARTPAAVSFGREYGRIDEGSQLAELLVERAADLLAEREYGRIDNPVDDPRPLAMSADDPLVEEKVQVLRDIRVPGLEGLAELTDRCLASDSEGIDQSQAHRLGQRTKLPSHELLNLLVDQLSSPHSQRG